MSEVFSTRIYGKCILAGEHSVLRGSPALVVPVRGSFLDIRFKASEKKEGQLEIVCDGEQKAIWDVLATGVVDKACEKLGLDRGAFAGTLELKSNLSLGAGMGASATLCVGVARCFYFLGLLKTDIYEFARSLEDIFHGESSGVDIAVALEARAIRFEKDQEKTELQMHWQPNLYLTYSGNKGITSECVAKVKKLFELDLKKAQQIDAQMMSAVSMMETSLKEEAAIGLKKFTQAMKLASKCFEDWDLLGGGLKEKMADIESLGALAVKPTGSGNGGYILSCWSTSPPNDSPLSFIPIS